MITRKSLLLLSLALVASCKTAGPDFVAPTPPPPQAGYASDGAGRAALGEGPEARWWTAFGSPELDALVDSALAHNHNLAASMATLERSREHIRAVAGRSKPQVDINGRADYEQINLNSFGFSPDAFGISGSNFTITNPHFGLFSLGAGVSYDLDLFGKLRRGLEQSVAEAEAQQRQTEAAHLLIAGRVTQQVIAIAALNDRILTERALLAEDDRNVDLTQARQRGGVGTMVEVLSAQGQQAADNANLPPLEQQLAEGRAMLAILVGLSPAELGPTDLSLDRMTLPGTVPVALPSALVHKRPDILEAEARLHSATAAIGVATASLYPDITLGASLTQSASKPWNIFNGGTSGWDLFSGITAPIINGGRLKAQKREAEAAARASAETYQQVVLEAFGQVSNLLSSMGTDRESLAAQSRSAEIAERSLYLSRRSFQVGNSGILQVLDASRANQKAKLALLEARSRQYLNTARLVVATAGGWTGSGATPEVAAAKP
jgi:NodT family efflux transporter outer membrane factor (OMF) lipoprotein